MACSRYPCNVLCIDASNLLFLKFFIMRADSTVKKYLITFKCWKSWAIAHSLVPVPAKPYEFSLYLQHIGETSKSKSSVEEACNAVSWVYSTAGLIPLRVDPFVKVTLEGMQCLLARSVMKKEPATVEMLEAIVDDADKSGLLSDLRLATACLFIGVFRISSSHGGAQPQAL